MYLCVRVWVWVCIIVGCCCCRSIFIFHPLLLSFDLLVSAVATRGMNAHADSQLSSSRLISFGIHKWPPSRNSSNIYVFMCIGSRHVDDMNVFTYACTYAYVHMYLCIHVCVCMHNVCMHMWMYVGRGGALVESMPFDRRGVDSNPDLAAPRRDLGQGLNLQLPVALRQFQLLWSGALLKGSCCEKR